MSRSTRILLTGGGTGGHVYPGLAVAEALTALARDVEVRFAGTRRGLEAVVVPRAGYRLHHVPASGVRGLGGKARLAFVVNFGLGLLASLLLMLRWRPAVVLGTGGYVSGPVLTAARLLGVPCCVQEQNAVPGSANRLVARWSRRLYLGDDGARRFFAAERCRMTGNPVRAAFVEAVAAAGGEPAPAPPPTADVPDGAPGRRVLVFGGSGGAHTLNEAVRQAAGDWAPDTTLSLWIQTGTREIAAVRDAFGLPARQPDGDRHRLRVVPYIQDMPTALRWADLVVCRAGAMTLAELQITGRAAILVPFPHATDQHQLHNARACEQAGAALVLTDDDCDGPRLVRLVTALLDDGPRRRTMARAARGLARPGAARAIAADLLDLAGHAAGERLTT